MRIVFMGTPDFAVPSLIKIAEEHEVVAVVTATDKPSGRGKKVKSSPIKTEALNLGIPVLQPNNLKAESFIEDLKDLNADLYVVVAFRMLPESVWSIPPKGTINLHGSLLPQYRGAAPINRAIMAGETKTGLTTFFIEKNIDTGEIIDQIELPISDEDSAGTLHDKMMSTGADLLIDTIGNIQKDQLVAQAQIIPKGIILKAAPKIFKEDCKINWKSSAKNVYNHIRGLSPFPGAWTSSNLENTDQSVFKIFRAKISSSCQSEPGTIKIENNSLFVASSDDWIELLELQAPGKKRMATQDFIRGYHFPKEFSFI